MPCRSRSNTACWRFWSGVNIAARLVAMVQLHRRTEGTRGQAVARTPNRDRWGLMAGPCRSGWSSRWVGGTLRLEAFALQPLAFQLAGAADSLSRLAGPALGRLLVMPPQLHLAEDPFPLHLLLERLQRLIDIVVTHQN